MAAWYPLPGSLRGPKGDPGTDGADGADGGTSPHAARHATGGADPLAPSAIGAAADADVVHRSGAETVQGLKTFVNGVAVAQPSAANMAVRHDDPRLSDARTPTGHTHPATAVVAAPRTVAYADLAGLAAAGGVALDVVNATLTANPTITPAAGSDGQVIRLRLYAGAASRTVTLAGSVRLATGIDDRALTIPADQAGVLGIEFLAGLGTGGAWVLFSKYATGS